MTVVGLKLEERGRPGNGVGRLTRSGVEVRCPRRTLPPEEFTLKVPQ